jgi:hypothetical protein
MDVTDTVSRSICEDQSYSPGSPLLMVDALVVVMLSGGLAACDRAGVQPPHYCRPAAGACWLHMTRVLRLRRTRQKRRR